MSSELKAGFLVSIMIGLSLISVPIAFGSSEQYLSAQENQTLFFQTVKVGDFFPYNSWLMDLNMPTGEAGIFNEGYAVYFFSQPLAQDFTFQTINVTIYHEEIPSDRGTFSFLIYLGFYDSETHFVEFKWEDLVSGSKVTSVLMDFDTKVLEGERLYVEIHNQDTYNLGFDMYYGNSTYPSQISYEGNVIYVPEFSQLAPLFVIVTLLAVIIYKRRPL